jgi:hypothetical protein
MEKETNVKLKSVKAAHEVSEVDRHFAEAADH